MKKCLTAVFLVVFLAGSVSLWAVQGQPQPQPKTAPKQPQPKTQQEFDAFNKFNAETDSAKKAAAGEQFIKDFPSSELISAYVNPTLMMGYQALNNYEKTLEYGEKVLSTEAGNPLALFVLALVIPERVKDDDLDRVQKLEKTTNYANKLIEVTNAMQKPPQATDDQWKTQKGQLLGGAHSALGFVALHRKEYDEAVKEYKTSVELFNKDSYAFYRLGIAYNYQKKSDEAIQALVNAVTLNGPAQVKTFLEQVYKAKHNGSLDGLDKMITDAAAQLK